MSLAALAPCFTPTTDMVIVLCHVDTSDHRSPTDFVALSVSMFHAAESACAALLTTARAEPCGVVVVVQTFVAQRMTLCDREGRRQCV